MNLIGEHTDYNGGLALPFAIAQGVTVRARAGAPAPLAPGAEPFVRGAIAELRAAGIAVPDRTLTIASDLPQGAGLSSSAALTVAVCMALIAAAGAPDMDRIELARLCSRVENDRVGARTGLLDQLACLCARAGSALLIDFATLELRHVPLALGDWRLVLLDSGERRALGSSAYNARRAECERGDPRRLRHVASENERVRAAVAALDAGDVAALGPLLDASHASLRDDFEASTPAVERTVAALRAAGAAGARMVGGGFGGQVLGLLPPGAAPPRGARAVAPAGGARLL